MILEHRARIMQYGQVTVNVQVVDGVADLLTLNIVVNKRTRY